MVVSWYGPGFEGKPTASGEIFRPEAMTAASNQYPLGTTLRVTASGRSVVVRVNDRTAKKYADRIDLTPAAFTKLAPLKTGLVEAQVEVLK
jgi:rare lipoprotein A